MTERPRKDAALVEWLALTIDCPDANALADFYATALGGEVYRRTDDCAFVRTPELALVFRTVPDYRPTTWPSPDVPLRSHLELVVGDPETAAQQMLRLGARLSPHQDPDDPHLVVMLDPAGHPFCLIRSGKAQKP